jgi:hypothetical protein
MTKQEIEDILDRVRTWPLERQEHAAALLLMLEGRGGVYRLSEAELGAIEEAEAEIARGDFASDEEVEALFDRYRAR